MLVAGALALFVLSTAEGIRGEHGDWTTFGWSLVALLLAGLGFLWQDRAYRRTGLGLFSLAVIRVAAVDTLKLPEVYRVLAYLCLGISLIAVSFLYSRFRTQLRRWL